MSSKTGVSILRVGSSTDRLAGELTTAVLGHLQPGTANNKDAVVQISNRYFDADVALRPLVILEEKDPTVDKEDGILLVFEDSSKQSFDVLAQLHAKAEANRQDGDLLRMCIGVLDENDTATMPMSNKEREDEYARRVLWCLDHGYEYVEKVDLKATEKGHDEREKEGFARIIEAIQGTVWSCAKMHPKKKQASYQPTQPAVPPPEEKNNYEPPTLPVETVVSEQESKEREESAKQALLQQDEIPEENHSDDNNNNEAQTDRIREHQADKITADMEGALKEANRIRDMSRAGELSDDDRKQRAGDAATLLLNLMNQMGGLESDDSETEEEMILKMPRAKECVQPEEE